ncbi:hypothetical protein STEG23_013076 [Scotinomys teguina]
MGASSSHPIFLALNELLLSKKLKIKKSTLERFLEECDAVAPWFAVSRSLTIASWEKLGHNLDFEAEQGTLKSGVRPVWKLVKGCLEDHHCSEAVENGQAALAALQEERSKKAGSEKTVRKKERGSRRLYPNLTELEDSDASDTGSEYTDEIHSIIEQLEGTNMQVGEKTKRKKGAGSGNVPVCCNIPSAPPPYGTGGSSNSFSPEAWRMVRTEMNLAYPVFQDPQGQRYHEPLDFRSDQQDPVWVLERLVRRIPEDRKAEDVASTDDVGSAEPAVVDDIGPAVPPNGDHARTSILGPVESVALSFAYFNSVWGAPILFYY